MANVAAIRIEHARLSTKWKKSNARMARRTGAGGRDPEGLLPGPALQWSQESILQAHCGVPHGRRRLLRFLRLPNGRVAMLLGDVAGKGMPAALMMIGAAGARPGTV